MSTDSEDEKFLQELEALEKKYQEILSEINKAFRRELRGIGIRKNVIPTKYILPKDYISKLLEYKPFRIGWQGKVLWVKVMKRVDPKAKGDEEPREWARIQAFPNIGGVLVEEGPELKVELTRIPRRKRQRRK